MLVKEQFLAVRHLQGVTSQEHADAPGIDNAISLFFFFFFILLMGAFVISLSVYERVEAFVLPRKWVIGPRRGHFAGM